MSEHPRLSALQSYVELGPGRLRKFRALSITVSLAALVLGAAYGNLAGGLALLGGVFLGALIFWQVGYLSGKEVYGNLVIAVVCGPLLALLVISTALSLALDVPLLSVVWATAPKVFVNALSILFLVLVGIAGGGAVSAFDIEFDDRLAVVLVVGGVLAFGAIQFQVNRIIPETAVLTSPMFTEQTTNTLRLYGMAGILAAGGALVALGSLLDSHARMRLFLVGVLISSLFVGAAGVGRVQGNIYQLQQAESVGERVTVDAVELELTEGGIRMVLELTNPTDSRVARGGAFVEVTDADGDRLAFGPAIATKGQPQAVEPGETVRVTYVAPLSDSQHEQLQKALAESPVTVAGSQSFRVADTEFTIEFTCTWDGETCRPAG